MLPEDKFRDGALANHSSGYQDDSKESQDEKM